MTPTISLPEFFHLFFFFFFKHKSKMTGDFNVFNFLQRSVEGKHLTRFLSVFKFLWRDVDGTHVIEKRETARVR